MIAESLVYWLGFAVFLGTVGLMVVGTLFLAVRALIQLVQRFFED